MEKGEFSSASFDTEFVDIPSEAQSKPVQGDENLVLENQRLQQVNKQLQETINVLKDQLKDALVSADKSKQFIQQIQTLKEQLQEALHQKEILERKNEESSFLNTSSSGKMLADIDAMTREKTSLEQRNKELENTVQKLKKEKSAFKKADVEKTQMIDLLTETIQKDKISKKKQKKNLIEVMDENIVLKNKVDQLTLVCQQNADEKTRQNREMEDLQAQIDKLSLTNDELKRQIAMQNADFANKDSAISDLLKELQDMKEEFALYEKQRSDFSLCLTKMNKLSVTSESYIQKLLKEKQQLELQLEGKPQAKTVAHTLNQANILDLNFPFHGDIKNTCEEIIKLPQYEPIQRLQLIFNELAKQVATFEDDALKLRKENDELKEELKHDDVVESKYKQILFAFFRDLKNIAVTEVQISQNDMCSADQKFINFVTQKAAEIDPLFKDDIRQDPLFIPDDFFSTTDVKKQKSIIESIIGTNSTVSALFTAQFLANSLIRKQLETTTGPLNQYEELSKLSLAHGADIADLPNIVQSQKEEIEKLKETKKNMHIVIKKLQASKTDLAKKDIDQRTQISSLQLKNDTLARDNDVLKMKIQVLSNEIMLKSNEALNPKQGKADEEKFTEKIAQLENELDKKNKENIEMSKSISSLQRSITETVTSQQRNAKKLEDSYQQKLIDLQEAYTELQQKANDKRKQTKKNVAALKNQYESALTQITNNYEEIKKTLEENINSLNAKLASSRNEIQHLNEALKTSECKCDQVTKINTNLTEKSRQIEQEISKIKAEFNKEKQILQSKLTTTTFNAESQLHDSLQALEEKYLARITKILTSAHETIGSFYGISEEELTEESLPQVLLHARDDLDKLRFFQKENLQQKNV